MPHAVSGSPTPQLLGRLVGRRPALRPPVTPDDFASFAELPARAEALAESARPYLDRARRGRPQRRRGRGRLVIACAILGAVAAAAAWAAWRPRRDDEYARLIGEPDRPRIWPVASGPSAPTAPADPTPSPDRGEEVEAPTHSANAAGQPAGNPVRASAGRAARARTQFGPALPASPAPSQYLRSNRTELPPVPGARPTLPR